MGLRDKIKKTVGTLAAGISIALAAPGVSKAMDEGGVAVQPRLVLPSQEAFMYRCACVRAGGKAGVRAGGVESARWRMNQ